MARLIMDYEDDQQAVQREMEIKGKLLLVSVVEGVHMGVGASAQGPKSQS